MLIYCLEDFKTQFDKLKKNNSYSNIEKVIVDSFFNKKKEDFFRNGSKINGTNESPYIKKRLSGSGGYRCHYLLLIKNDKIYLMYIHPKTGSMGMDNTGEKFEKAIYKKAYSDIESGNYYEIINKKGKLTFRHNILDEIKLDDLGSIETIEVIEVNKDKK